MKHSMISRIFDNLLGRGSAAVTVPPMDGALKPNNQLENLQPGIPAAQVDDIVEWKGEPLWSDGATLVSRSGVQAELPSVITALAALDDTLVVATLDDGLILLGGDYQRAEIAWATPITNVTAISVDQSGVILFCTGSQTNAPNEWRRDLMETNQSGMIGRANPKTGEVRILAKNLRYPSGIATTASGSIVYSEAWASHIVEMSADGSNAQIIFDEIPGYPGRLCRQENGTFWLSVFAPRNPLIEFVLREPAYRKAMLQEVAPEFWIAPHFYSGRYFNEPMQGGALKQMGILKPWAPTRSYGLVIELSSTFIPLRSFHSRTGGSRHGITSALQSGNTLWMACRGNGEILEMQLVEKGKAL
ncbi:hypothetical protein [Sulfitobacter sp. SH22]|uniref:hypothetical protein n=1 Tax=Sulfitobacter sp. SH22 TaxID=3421172 RepID=UPI003F4FA900